jgi:proline iminopeptidase
VIRVLALSAVALVAASVLGVAALVAAARVSDRPPVFLAVGLAVFLLATALGTRLAARGARATGRRWVLFLGAAGIGIAAFLLGVLLPLRDPQLPPRPVPGLRTWQLPAGSSIAYVHVPARGRTRPTPIVFLHGGPGIPDLRGDSAYFGRLAADGFDVYVYAQVGSGRSSRLADPREYTVARHARDLEAIRRRIGARRLILVAHSWGALIAAVYTAQHPQRVARLAVLSPHPLDPEDGSGGNVLARLGTRDRLSVYSLVAQPRAVLAYTLLQVNPRAAIALVGDEEMDARLDRVYNRSRASLHCDGQAPGPELHGLGFYSYQFPQSAAAPRPPDPRRALPRLATPALVVKGSCDYLSWSSATDYARALARARLVYLRDAGHNVYRDRPEAVFAVLRAFLNGRPLPLHPLSTERRPLDYEGLP